jgi:hypothetical protein
MINVLMSKPRITTTFTACGLRGFFLINVVNKLKNFLNSIIFSFYFV